MEKFLQFFIKHNALLIEAMIGLILVTAAFLAYRSFKNSKDEETGVLPADMGNLEETLKKILEKANQIPTQNVVIQAGSPAAAAAGAGSAEASSLAVEITKLKEELQKKQTEIEGMKSTGAGATASAEGLSLEEKNALNAQVNELKRKLEEYAIISADIADLSFYKEESARLQKELAAKGTAAAPAPASSAPAAPAAPVAAPTPPPETPPAPAPAAPTPVVPEPVAAAPIPEPAAPAAEPAAAIPPTTKPEHAVENVIDDDIMKDFAAAVADQGGSAIPEIEIPPMEAAPAETPSAPADAAAMPEIDIPAIGDEKPKTEENLEAATADNQLGSLDIDKMVSEVGALPDASSIEIVDSLGGTMDPDKLAMEADTLTADAPKTEDKDLMGQFENFVKKEKT